MNENQLRREVYPAIALRRAQVLGGLADFRTEREIADALYVEQATVRTHVQDLKTLIGVRTVRELGRRWWTHHENWECFYKQEARRLWRRDETGEAFQSEGRSALAKGVK